MDFELDKRKLALCNRIVANFHASDWDEVGHLFKCSDLISKHPRLLRSLGWGDEDYAENALAIIERIVEQDEDLFTIFEKHVAGKFPE
jgi:hypothetical protein